MKGLTKEYLEHAEKESNLEIREYSRLMQYENISAREHEFWNKVYGETW